jgi:hypothetical protein
MNDCSFAAKVVLIPTTLRLGDGRLDLDRGAAGNHQKEPTLVSATGSAFLP